MAVENSLGSCGLEKQMQYKSKKSITACKHSKIKTLKNENNGNTDISIQSHKMEANSTTQHNTTNPQNLFLLSLFSTVQVGAPFTCQLF